MKTKLLLFWNVEFTDISLLAKTENSSQINNESFFYDRKTHANYAIVF